MSEIKKSRLWSMSEKLIGFDTVSYNSNSEAAAMIAGELDDLGFKTHIEHYDDHGVQKSQVVAWIGPEVEDGLILSGHIDTVPFATQSGWTKDALKMTLDGDKIFGRGMVDMKMFITHCLDAFSNIDFSKLKKPIVCIFTSDEETGCHGAHRLTTKLDAILENMPCPKRAIIGEPTGFDIINTHKGICQFNVIVEGVPGHSSRPDLGKNAIETARKVIQATEELNEKYKNETPDELANLFPDFPYNHLNLATINGGDADNMIPNLCKMHFSYRTIPGRDDKQMYHDLKAEVEKLNLSDPVKFEFVKNTKSMPKANNPELESLLKDLSGNNPRSVSFATDGGEFATMGIDCYVFGAGDISQAHMPDEYMTVEHFNSGSQMIQNIINKLLF